MSPRSTLRQSIVEIEQLLASATLQRVAPAIEELSKGMEPFPSYFRRWTAKPLESIYILAGQGREPFLGWRKRVEAGWIEQLPTWTEHITRPTNVAAALEAFPANASIPPESP